MDSAKFRTAVAIAGCRHAGKSMLLKLLEESGWTCVDNLPPELTGAYLDTPAAAGSLRVAIGLDLSGAAGSGGNAKAAVSEAVEAISSRGALPRLVFLAAGETALKERASAGRREEDGSARDRERSYLEPIAGIADLVIDSTWTPPRDELDRVLDLVEGGRAPTAATIEVLSFGYKFGVPHGDVIVDLRFLPNPYYIQELRPLSGRDAPCAEYVMSQKGSQEILAALTGLAGSMAKSYSAKGRHKLRFCLGCTGGWHRSVAMAEAVSKALSEAGSACVVKHRELDKA